MTIQDLAIPRADGTWIYKGWILEYVPKPGRAGLVDWDATHPDVEEMLNGKSVEDLKLQIDELLQG